MQVVFVVDTSPSMAEPAASPSSDSNSQQKAKGISRLDVAKMAVESLARSMDKRIMEHNRSVVLASAQVAAMVASGALGGSGGIGGMGVDVGKLEHFDEFLLLSTSLQPDEQPVQRRTSFKGTNSSSSIEEKPPALGIKGTVPFVAIASAAEAHSSCGAGGRLLVGCVDSSENNTQNSQTSSGVASRSGVGVGGVLPHPTDRADFERELKRLRVAFIPEKKSDINANKKQTFPEWAGGAIGLNAALSHGLGLLSRYRLTRGRFVENFGMGRLPWFEHQMTKLTKEKSGCGVPASGNSAAGEDSNFSKNDSPLQPACLILLTDGECLRRPPDQGGGNLRLQFGNMPLREFYKEPFRWDQRIFIFHVGDSSPPLHQSLRALCEVTGGAYMKVQPPISCLSKVLPKIFPPRPKFCSVPNPLRLPIISSQPPSNNEQIIATSNIFVNGGPVCCFQSLEGGVGENMPSLHRAMILFAGPCEQTRWILNPTMTSTMPAVQNPVWSIPENFFPSKKLDALPPRPSQPLLNYSRSTYQAVGSPVFDPLFVMKALHHLDQLQVSIRQLLVDAGDSPPPMTNRMLQRDVYICDWLGGQNGVTRSSVISNMSGAPRTQPGKEHFPVCIRGAGRPNLAGEGGDNFLNIGILHIPHDWIRLKELGLNASKDMSHRLSTLTLLPPDPHILIPLLIRVAEMELRILKKAESSKEKLGNRAGATAGLIKKKVSSATASRAIHLDENWKSEFRAYLFRLPPYYFPAIRRVLRPMLPPSTLSLLSTDGQESLPSLCFSRVTFQKILTGEKVARDGNDWLKSMERDLRHGKKSFKDVPAAPAAPAAVASKGRQVKFGSNDKPSNSRYGQYPKDVGMDTTSTRNSFLCSLRNMPPPWKEKGKDAEKIPKEDKYISLCDVLDDLPSSCLLPYYESRRRWIFGCTGLVARGLHVEGVNNDGTNAHHISSKQTVEDEPLIALAGIGASTVNETNIVHMGDFKERLQFSRTPLAGCGGTNLTGSPVTSAADGSPTNSVDDDVLPLNFFDQNTGQFLDSNEIRQKARLMINFGNPFETKTGDSFVPEKYSHQRPPLNVGENEETGPNTPPGSPPHDAYDSPVEGEGEAAFTGKKNTPPVRSARHGKLTSSNLLSLRQKRGPVETHAQEAKRRKNSPEQNINQDVLLVNNLSKEAPESIDVQEENSKTLLQSQHRPPPPKSQPKVEEIGGTNTAPPLLLSNNRTALLNDHTQRHKSQKKDVFSRKPAPPGMSLQNLGKPPPPKRHASKEALPTNANAAQQTQQSRQQPLTPPELAKQLQNPDSKPKINLPPGWVCVWSKSQKRWYFFDTKTNKSVWQWPPPGGVK